MTEVVDIYLGTVNISYNTGLQSADKLTIRELAVLWSSGAEKELFFLGD